MFRCMFCSRLLLSINFLMIHIKLNHKSRMHCEVKCNVENCFQIYNNIYSLKRHILSEHVKRRNDLKFIREKNILQQTSRNILHPILNNTNSILNVEYNNIISQISSTFDVNNDNYMFVFKEKLNECVTHFVAKLYAYGTMNRIIH